ncbi:hypothetical protein COJ85_13950 [Bacillus sp. AFS076308]|uniref:DUF5677 domain-containing protein n=1 Tax=Bacillus sp. AFS076308 TaxID=2033512 RepID=UPI000BF862F8|nr:DUF5677 domain-containing protein [Bacillus sp. AFS076308]PFO03742.1 hypothetical protein COJ85_13950 [Bacillus sp. AFS076308]
MSNTKSVYDIKECLNDRISNVYDIWLYLEESEQFQNGLDKDLKQHFYHLYLKCKRNFEAINILMKSEELPNSYVETTVLLRVMTEGYLHLSYLMMTDKETVIKEYNILNDFKLKQMLNGINKTYKIKVNNKAELKTLKRLRQTYRKKEIIIPEHFNKMYILAGKTGNKGIYDSIYQMFNTYVHFNPTTYLSYGSEDGKGIFTFNSYTPRPYLEARILFYAISVQMLLLARIYIYLQIKTVPKYIADYFTNWEKFKEKDSKVILQNTDDYI